MTTTVERAFEVQGSVEDVWAAISDPAMRAEAISVVESFHQEGDEMIWQLRMPIRLLPGTIAVRTRDVERDPPNFVRFIGKSGVMDVEGQHKIESANDECIVRNRFVVDGHFPGVETFFQREIDSEIENLLAAVDDRLPAEEHE